MLLKDTDLQMYDNFRTNNPQTQIRNFIALSQIYGLKELTNNDQTTKKEIREIKIDLTFLYPLEFLQTHSKS